MAENPNFNSDAMAQFMQQATAQMVKTVQESVKPAVDNALNERVTQAQQRQQEQERARTAQTQQQQLWEDPVARTVLPVVGPLLAAQELRNNIATDNAKFYLRNPDALEYEGYVEKIVNDSAAAGRPIDHASAWDYFKGKNLDHFAEKRMAQKQAAEEAAKMGITMGPAGMTRINQPQVKITHETPLEDMRKALSGIAF